MRELLERLELLEYYRRIGDPKAQTKQTVRLEAALEDLEKDLRKVTMGYHGWYGFKDDEKAKEGVAKAISRKAKEVLKEMVLTFEDPEFGKLIKKKLKRWENFRKMLKQFADAKSWAEMEAISKSLQTKSKWAFDKYWDYKQFALMAIRALDVEKEAVVDVGPFSVVLLTAAGIDWDKDRVERVRAVLTKVMRDLKSVGLGAVIGGKVHAFPSSTVPISGKGGGGTLASYNYKNDLLRVAAGRDDMEKLAKTVTHEFGHRAYAKLLGNRGRKAWEEFFGANVGKPDIRQIMSMWEEYAKKEKYGAWLGYFYKHLKKVAPDQIVWLELAAEAAGVEEKFHEMTGAPTKSKKNIPGLEQFKKKAGEIRVFLHPVTTYSGKDPAELFAETFAYIIQKGPKRIPPVVRHAFVRALPQIRGGKRMMEDILSMIESRIRTNARERDLLREMANHGVAQLASFWAPARSERSVEATVKLLKGLKTKGLVVAKRENKMWFWKITDAGYLVVNP